MKICDVTVVIPNYNRTTLLRRALQSVSEQTCLPREVIVVDDCSSSEHAEEIESIVGDFAKRIRIKLLVNSQNRGANHSRNRGIFEAISKYVAFLDSDDLWMPEKLGKQMDEVEKTRKIVNKPILSATGRYRVDGTGRIIIRQFGGRSLKPEKIRRSNFIGTLSSTVVETWIARHIRGFNESLPACQDWDFFIRLSDYVQYVGIPEPLCVYVDHAEDRITLNHRKRLRAHIFIYRNHVRPSLGPTESPSDEFYRNIAEDYQELGYLKRASKFFAKAVAISKARDGQRPGTLSELYWSLHYRWISPPIIKLERYVRYRQLMAKIMADPKLSAEIAADGAAIDRMMATNYISRPNSQQKRGIEYVQAAT